jgi:hypothetical protein
MAKRGCSVEGCGRSHQARGLCSTHYRKLKRSGALSGLDRTCSVEACGGIVYARGMCNMHWSRLRRTGSAGGSARRKAVDGEPLSYALHLIQNPPMGCVYWPFAANTGGYGVMRLSDGQNTVVSTFVCEQVHGERPGPDYEAAHSCGRGSEGCISPACMSWKTRSANQMDRVEHGTSNRGTSHANAKLTEHDVRMIRTTLRNIDKDQLAIRFGVSESCIRSIWSGKTWAWLDP